MSIRMGERRSDAPKGSFVLIPGGVTHDFENHRASRAAVLNFSVPGDFEQHIPAIVQWFVEHPPQDIKTLPARNEP